MEITHERYLELVKTEMLYRMVKNALKQDVPYRYILVMLGEVPQPISTIRPDSTIALYTGPVPEAQATLAYTISEQTPTVDPPKPKATIKRPIANGTKYSGITPEKIEQIKTLTREGKTVKEIAEMVGVSDPTVRKYKAEVPIETGDIEESV